MQNPHLPTGQNELRNLMLTVFLCVGLLWIWQVTYTAPKQKALEAELKAQQAAEEQLRLSGTDVLTPQGEVGSVTGVQQPDRPREELVKEGSRVRISTPALHGSINLKGLRLDDLTLVRHRQQLAADSPEVVLLSPSGSSQRNFLQLGWLPAGSHVRTPDTNSVWQADRSTLTPDSPVSLRWDNGEGVVFVTVISVDKDYLFTFDQRVENHSGQTIAVAPYGLVNRNHNPQSREMSIVHTGPLGVFNQELTELDFADIEEEKKTTYANTTGWLGITDKYWLTTFIPESDENFTGNFTYQTSTQGSDRVQVDYLVPARQVRTGSTTAYTTHVFAGAKELDVLERYEANLNIPLFDRALDFGVLYFLTKPIFLMLDYLYGVLGNFGLAILVFVVFLKIVLFPLSNKSYHSMAQMRLLQPEIERIKKEYGDDKMRMQQEMLALWKRERVNPASGCLPLLIQLPIFFALYKVLMVTIEMRHAPFYGWIHDLSAKDPTNVFTLFGLIPWDPPSLLHIGLWPIIMCATSVLQQKLNPKPADPVQAKVIGIMPYAFLILFAGFPAGLLIYWAWNNILSVMQQAYITNRYERQQARKKAKKSA